MKLSACVIYQDGDDMIGWRKSLPLENIEVIALRTEHNPNISAPRFTEVGRTSDTIALNWEYPDFEEYFDFSFLRNKLDDYASGDWILHMDSDERLASPHDELWVTLQELENSDTIAAYVSIAGVYEKVSDENPTYRERYCMPNMRLHRRAAYLRWEGICHETLDFNQHGSTIADSDILLYHKGYSQSKDIMSSKSERNAKLLIREYTRCKSDRNWNYLINTFAYIKSQKR